MKKLIIILLLLPLTSFSQNFIITDTIFLDKNWEVTLDRSQAEYYRGTLYNSADSTFLVHDFYLDNFSIQMIGFYKYTVKNSNQIGEFKYYYKNGNLRANYNYLYGKFHGNLTRYYKNGNIQSIEKYKSGILIDTSKYFYKSGKPREIKYANPNFNSDNFAETEKEFQLISFWDEDGNQQIKNGNGTRIDYYENGKKKVSIQYVDGFPHGEWIQFKEKRGIISKMNFKNGTFISGMMYPKRNKDIFASLYREPRFPNGIKALDEFVKKHVGKCKESFKQEILLMINISDAGDASFDQIISGDYSHCQFEELNELVRHMPKWIPAVRYGLYVESTFVVRINY